MIVQEQDDQLILVRQTDHSVLSGFFAREWGNDLFQRPEPLESVRLATGEHDNGWREWELQPHIDPKTRLPYSFMSLPTEEHIELYQRGIERVFKVDLRADAATKDFVQEKLLESNSRRLEALDRLSLYFCMSATPHDATIDGVPVDDSGSEADWELRPDGPNAVSLGPYPFRREPLQISILTRRVPKRLYTGSLDFQTTLARAPYTAVNFTLHAGRALSAARFAVA